jgi:hypothetical protein
MPKKNSPKHSLVSENSEAIAARAKKRPENLDEQGSTANLRQNITNQGHQQDR